MGGALKPHNVRYIAQRVEQRHRHTTSAKRREALMTPEQRLALTKERIARANAEHEARFGRNA